MTKSIYKEKAFNNSLWIAAFILFHFCISCKAQTPLQSLLEPAPGSPIGIPCGPGNIAAGDLNNDSKPDLVAACGENRSLTIFMGRGNGEFDVPTSSPLLLPYPPNEIVIRDMNMDAHADLIVASHDSYGILILPGDGKGNFIVPADSLIKMKDGNLPHTHGLGVGDLNNDTLPDLVTANNSDNDIAVLLNNGRGSFIPAPGSPFPVSLSPYPLTIGDVNNDKYLDIVSTSTNASSKVLTVLLGDGRGNFRRSDIPLRSVSPWFVAIDDINNDQIPDLVTTHSERSELTVLTGTGGEKFTEVTGSPFRLGSSAWHVAIADLNGDAKPDVIAAANNGIRVMLGDGKGQFVSAPGSPFSTGKGTWHLAISDVNSDGKWDVVTSNLESNSISVLLGK